MREGGEQPEENDQSVTKVNSIRPSLSGSLLGTGEPLTARSRPNDGRFRSVRLAWTVGAAAATMNELGNVRNRAWRNGDAVVGDGMVRSSNELSRENCQLYR